MISGSVGLLQMIIRINQPLANDHLDGPASCKWSSFSFSVILLLHKNISSFSKYFPPFPLLFIFSTAKNIFSVSKCIPHFPPYRFLPLHPHCSSDGDPTSGQAEQRKGNIEGWIQKESWDVSVKVVSEARTARQREEESDAWLRRYEDYREFDWGYDSSVSPDHLYFSLKVLGARDWAGPL